MESLIEFVNKKWKYLLVICGASLLIYVVVNFFTTKAPLQSKPSSDQVYSVETQNQIQKKQLQQINYSSPTIMERIEDQNIGDTFFSESGKQMADAYPWFRDIPIYADTYTVVFDYEQQKFRIVVKPGADKPTATSNALQALRDIGVQITATNYYVQ